MYRTTNSQIWLFLNNCPIFSLISVLLDRGNKLRNAMVVSALKCDMDSAPTLKDTPLPLPKDNILPPSKFVFQKFVKKQCFLSPYIAQSIILYSCVCRPFPPPSGMFLQNILHADSTLKHSDDVAVISDCGLDCPADMDNRAVDLLLGRYLLYVHIYFQSWQKISQSSSCPKFLLSFLPF